MHRAARPVSVSKFAHTGLFVILKTSGSLLESRAVGRKPYAVPTVALVAGVPEIVGATFERDLARIENAGSDVVFTPSLTRIWMPVQ